MRELGGWEEHRGDIELGVGRATAPCSLQTTPHPAACSVLYLTSVETESLTGPQAVARASSAALSCSPRPTPAVVHFKVSAQGITLTDNQRK